MKMAKRIFIALLTLSVIFSAIAFSVSAESAPKVDFEYLLEYYEEPTLFYYNFAEDNVDYSSSLLVKRTKSLTQAIVEDEAAPGGKALSLTVAAGTSILNSYADNHVYFSWSSDDAIDDFMVNMTVCGEKGTGKEQNLPRIILSVADEKCMEAATGPDLGTTIVAIDYRNGYFSYLKKTVATDGTVSSVVTNTSYTIEEGAWYNVSFKYNATLGTATVKVTNAADSTKSITVADAYIPYEAIRNVRVGEHGTDAGVARGSVMKFANVYAIGGKFDRNPNNRQSVIEAETLVMYQSFLNESVSLEDKIRICDIAKVLVDSGFSSEIEEVQNAVSALSIGVIGLYNQKIQICNDTYASIPTYDQKKTLIDETNAFAAALAEQDLSEISDELKTQIDENLAKLAKCNEDLAKREENSLKFIAAVDSVRGVDFADYVAVKNALSVTDGIEYDATYAGVAEAIEYYNKLVSTELDISIKAQRFIDTVAIANNSELNFNDRADAYRKLCGDYYFDNVTYPGIPEALALFNDELVPYIGTEITNAESFIKYVNKADYAVYVSAKQENLDLAKEYMDICQPEYKGVAEAKTLYAEIQKQVDEKFNNATAYINAVNALDSLTGSALSEAIKNAEKLKEAGDVLGVDGVTEANIKLSRLIASIELKDKYCVYFIDLVNSIDSASDAAALYKLLGLAKEAEADADKSYAGVSDASAKLEKAIADYNAKVNQINGAFDDATEAAANTCGVGNKTTVVTGHVIALIKKFFGEE